MDAISIGEKVLEDALSQTSGLPVVVNLPLRMPPPPMPRRPGKIPTHSMGEWRQKPKNRRVKLGQNSESPRSQDHTIEYRQLTARYKIRFNEEEMWCLRTASASVGHPVSALVFWAGFGRAVVLWDRIGQPGENGGPRRSVIEVSVNDSDWEELMQRIELAQPVISSGQKPIDFSTYFRRAAFGRLRAPALNKREQPIILRPLREEKALVAAQEAVWAASGCIPYPATLPRIQEAYSALECRIQAGNYRDDDEQRAAKLADAAARLASDTELGRVSQERWEALVNRINDIAKETT